MPNPFIKAGPKNLGQRPVDRSIPTGALDPKPEMVAGPVFAYRGMDPHGVAVDNGSMPVDEQMWDEAAEYDPEYEAERPEPDPIPVRVVQSDSIEIKRGYIAQLPVNPQGTPNQIIGNDYSNRARLLTRIKNVGTQSIYIGNDMSSASPMSGWLLAANETFESATHEGWWAVSSDGSQGKVAVYVAFTVNATHDGAHHGRN